jgi:murein L,D-transpeptidase YcbB/YkuD
MMRLRQIRRASLPAILIGVLMLAPGLHATHPPRVKHKVTKAHLHAVPSRRATRYVVRRKVTHAVHSRRARHQRRVYRRRTRFRMPARPSTDRIEQIQQALARTGFYQGDPSGKWDSGTVDAMKSFQEAHGLAPTGKIDATSLQQLGLGSDIAGLAPPRPLVAANRSGSSD